MSVQDPSPEGARSALTEVELRRAAVHASDRQFQPALIVFAGLWVAGMILIVVMPSARAADWFGPIEGLVVGALLAGGLVAFFLLLGRHRAHSRTGSLMFGASIVGWIFLNSWVHALGSNAGWYLPADPLRGAHFVLTAVISVAPLLVGALVVGRRR